MTSGAATVLVVEGDPAGRSRSSLAAVRALGAAGHAVFIAGSAHTSLAGASRHARGTIRVPPPDHPDFPASVRAVADELGTDLVLPASDPALWALRAPGHQLVDKRWLAARADEVGLSRLPTRAFRDGAELADAVDDVAFPCVVKVARRTGTSDPSASCLRGPDEAAAWFTSAAPLVVQPWVPARMRAVFGVVWDGAVVAIGAQDYRRSWPPGCGVASAAVTMPPPDEATIARVAALLEGHRGIFQLQFVGEWLIDVNPRVYGSLPLAVAAGTNLPALWCALARGEPVRPCSARPGIAYRWLDGDLRAIAHAATAGDRRALAGLRPRRGTVHSVSTIRDPRPGLARLGQLVLPRWPDRDPRAATDRGIATDPWGPGVPATAAILGLEARERGLVARLAVHRPDEVPDLTTAHRRVLADTIVRRASGNWDAHLRDDLLSPAWASDLDLHAPGDAGPTRVAGPDVLPLAPLARVLGAAPEPQWLVQRRGRGLSRLDVHSGDAPGALERVLDRCRRRHGPGVREVIELRRLQGRGVRLPRTGAVTAAARIEARAGGAVLADHLTRGWWPLPARRLCRPHAIPLRPRRVGIAFSGLDGAGKTTQVDRLARSLRAAGIPVHVVCARPGLRPVGDVDAVAPRSRRGVVGQVWATVVTLAFVWHSRPPMRFRRGVVLYDRHRLDAAATLEALYTRGRRSWHQQLLALTPSATVTVLLDLPVEVAADRKPDDVFPRRVLDAHQEVYAQAEARVREVVRVDGTAPPAAIGDLVLRRVMTEVAS